MVDASSAAVGVAKWIGSALVQEAKYLHSVEDQVGNLQRELIYMHQLLQDVDANPHLTRQDGQLRNFAEDIQDLAFRTEDAIDSYILNVATKIERKSLLLKFACLTAHSYPVHVLIKEIEHIQGDIKKARLRFDTFGIVLKTSGDVGSSSSSRESRPIRTENYIHLVDDVVVGIDADISHLAKSLVDLEQDFKVLAIIGTGGAGKTTLASQLYNNVQVKSRFPHKAFVSISQQWSRVDVLQRIFKEVRKEGDETPSSETELVRELHGFLKDKQCLIVLDDMWKTEAWDDIYPMLPRSNKGCRVIITTRIEEVPRYADKNCIIHEPKLLTREEKWELFSKVAVEGRVGIEKNAEFEKLGRQMLEKCEGLPLAVVTLAGVLRTKQELYQWEEISKAFTEYILKGKGKPNYGVVENMMELSYLDLPAYLKPCFLYFALFLEDWELYDESIIRMWIAEGFVTDDLRKGQETLEDVAARLLEELARRCVLKVTIRNIQGEIEKFRVHDLMREFCIKKAKDSRFVGPISSMLGSRQPRRTAVSPRELYPHGNDHLRTLFNIGYGGEELPIEARGNLESIPNKFKLLRVLYIWELDYVALPDQIGNLIHLKYLRIEGSKIFVLPKSIRNLRNLLYLIYTAHENVVEVPDGLVANMKNLRGLVLPWFLKRSSLNRLGLNGPKKLQWLRAGAGTWMTKELPTLSTTLQQLTTLNVQKKEEMEALYQCPCIRQDSLSELGLSYDRRMPSVAALEFDLEKLRNCTKLWDLRLECPLASNCNGTIIQLPPNLTRLYLSHSAIKERDDLMHVLGELPQLKELTLDRGSYLGTQLSCKTSGFQQLKVLRLRGLENLEEWRMEEGAMPRLRDLLIANCPKLKRLPESIRSIPPLELKIIEMPEEFRRRIGYKGSTSEAEDSYIIQHIPSVIVSVVGS